MRKTRSFTTALLLGVAIVCLFPQVARPDANHAIYPPPDDAFRRLRPVSRTWLAWWEANRDSYLEVVRQGLEQKPDPVLMNKLRKQAMGSLLATLKSDSLAMRASAALALGQMGDENALEPLAELARKDKEVQVRQAALLAIGLLDTPKVEQVLTEIAFQPFPQFKNQYSDQPSDRQAALLALGLMSQLSPDTVVNLQKIAGQLLSKPLRQNGGLDGQYYRITGPTPIMSPISAWALTRPLDPRDPAAPKLTREGGVNSVLHALAEGSGLVASAISCWNLASREDPDNGKRLQDVLNLTNVPWIANEAMLALGGRGGDTSMSGLAEILLGTPRGKTLPAYKTLEEQHDRLAYLWKVRCSKLVCNNIMHIGDDRPFGKVTFGSTTGSSYQAKALDPYGGIKSVTMTNAQAARKVYFTALQKALGGGVVTNRTRGNIWYALQMFYFQLHYGGEDYDAVKYKNVVIREYDWLGLCNKSDLDNTHQMPYRIYYINLGVEPIFMANLRASAAIALGKIDTPTSRAALRQVLMEKPEKKDEKDFDIFDYNVIYQSQAIMSLGQLGDADALPVLAELVLPPVPRRGGILKERIEDPLRGFAALAMGLYSRPAKTPQGLVDRKGFDKVYLLLAERMADQNEPEDFRAACALALGLSGRTENLKYLQPASKTVGDQDDLLNGYMILARGMLGDKTILESAKTFLAAKNNRMDRNGILGRRAAVLGLGLTGSREVIPVLVDCWNLGYHVARETALALTFCQGYDTAERLGGVMNYDKEKPETRALAARCLGELLMKERPSRLAARLINQSNYEMRIPRLTYYRGLANEFLFTYLMTPLAGEWETLTPN